MVPSSYADTAGSLCGYFFFVVVVFFLYMEDLSMFYLQSKNENLQRRGEAFFDNELFKHIPLAWTRYATELSPSKNWAQFHFETRLGYLPLDIICLL